MKKFFIILLLSLLSVSYSQAQTKQESIKQLFKLMKTDSLYDKMMESIVPTIMQQSSKDASDPEAAATMKKAIDAMKPIMNKMLNEDMVAIYDKYFTESEIKDYIAFYKSPSGQKFVNVTPAMQTDIMNIMMQKYMGEIQKAVMDTMK